MTAARRKIGLGFGRSLAVVAAFAGSAAAPAAAQTDGMPRLWAVPGLYGVDDARCGQADDGAQIAPLFCPQLAGAARMALGRRFSAAVAAQFPGVENRFAESLPADATVRARLASTLIVSLRLTRATLWEVPKPSGVSDVYLPLTLTIDVTDAASGEVVFTRSLSEIGQATVRSAAVREWALGQFDAHLDETMRKLVAQAAAGWQPRLLDLTVIGPVGRDWVVDKGRSDGLRAGEPVGDDGRVLYAGAHYAVVRPALAPYRKGQVLRRAQFAPAASLGRPSVLSVVLRAPPGLSRSYLTGLFEDALGARSGLSALPVNPGFVRLRTLALGEAQAPSATARALPDYVAALTVAVLPPARFSSNIAGVDIARYEARALVALVDRTGRVVATFEGADRIEDQIAQNIGMDAGQRTDTVVRNALVRAVEAMAAFRPVPLALPVATAGGHIRIADAGGALPMDAQLTVLRDMGRLAGVTERILAPVGQVRTTGVEGVAMGAVNADPTPIDLHAGDVVAVERSGPALLSRTLVEQCTGADGTAQVEERGGVPVPLWSALAPLRFAARFPAPVQLAELANRLADYAVSFDGWDGFAPTRRRPVERCFQPVIAVTPGDGGATTVAGGYRLLRAGQRVGGAGVQTQLTPTRLPADAPPAAVAAMLQQDIAALLPSLAEGALAKLPMEP